MASTKRTWLWIVLGVVGTLFLLFCLAVGGAIYEFRTHVKTEVVETSVAEQEFNQTRDRFRGQQPLVELVEGQGDRDDKPIVHRPPSDARRVEIHTLRVLIYDINNGHLIHADVPGWLLRMMRNSSGNTRTRTYGGGVYGPGFDISRTPITIEDLERHGYGLVMDGRNRNSRILVWSE